MHLEKKGYHMNLSISHAVYISVSGLVRVTKTFCFSELKTAGTIGYLDLTSRKSRL